MTDANLYLKCDTYMAPLAHIYKIKSYLTVDITQLAFFIISTTIRLTSTDDTKVANDSEIVEN